VAVVKDGRTNFSELQAALAGGRHDEMFFYAFDLLYFEVCVPKTKSERIDDEVHPR
jgi:hypothetical protein